MSDKKFKILGSSKCIILFINLNILSNKMFYRINFSGPENIVEMVNPFDTKVYT